MVRSQSKVMRWEQEGMERCRWGRNAGERVEMGGWMTLDVRKRDGRNACVRPCVPRCWQSVYYTGWPPALSPQYNRHKADGHNKMLHDQQLHTRVCVCVCVCFFTADSLNKHIEITLHWHPHQLSLHVPEAALKICDPHPVMQRFKSSAS